MTKGKHRNVLPNTYIPLLSKDILNSVLGRLQKQSLIALISLWSRLKNTLPQLDKENALCSQTELNRMARQDAREMKENEKKWKKSKIIDKILYEYWNHGLNLLQLAQIDCQLIVDSSSAFLWNSSTVKDVENNDVPLNLDPSIFLNSLAAELSKVFMSYIYVCKHPNMPLILVRVQVFDLIPHLKRGRGRPRADQPHITSHKAYFLAFPLNSPHLIHSPGTDLVSQIILNVVENCLSHNRRNQHRLVTPENQKAVRSLESIHILKGCSRFSSSLGAWTPYADNTVDCSPLASISKQLNDRSKEERAVSHKDRVMKLANIRYKGAADGKVKSERLFDDFRPLKKLKLQNGDSQAADFSSVAPVRFVEYELQEKVAEDDDELSQIKVKFIGNDVFGGLHELASMAYREDSVVIDPTTVPGWLTGEEGMKSGKVRNGRFYDN
ncbi:hypothetical protein FDK38_001211 [Candidozyma auris]|nr:hypothetical protein FDK38_001211 [[Candida] auris]